MRRILTRDEILKTPTPWMIKPPRPDPRIRRAQKLARRAARAGDQASCDHWSRIALALAAVEARFERAASIGDARRVPVLLDPAGYSPSGMPNWYLNRERLDRAGLIKRAYYG